MFNLWTPMPWLCAMLMMLHVSTYAQTPTIFNKDWGLISENDGYALQNKDGYYTNGIFVHFSHVAGQSSTKNNLAKSIWTYEFGQQMYTPYNGSYYTPKRIDRPFAGYLYTKLSRSNFYANQSMFEWSFNLGILGKPSLADATQIGFHRLMKGYIPTGWDNQVASEPTVNIGMRYVKSILPTTSKKFLDVQAVGRVNVGTIFTNVSAGTTLLLGLMEPMYQSSFWRARLDNHINTSYHNKQTELFLSIQPTIEYQLYNATIQGPLLQKYKGPIVKNIVPFVYQCNVGLHFARPQWGAAIVWTHRSRDAAGMRAEQNYASLQLTFRSRKK